MSKELYFTDGNNEVKYLDTTASFNLAITQDGSAFDLTNATAIDVKVANDTGYVFTKSIDMATIKQPLAGLITMPVDAEVMNALVPDDYTIEVWVTLSSLITPGSQEGLTDTGSTTNTATSMTTAASTTTYNAIFPSDDPQGFTITENVMSDSGDVIPVMSLDEFQQKFDQLKTDLTNKVATLQGPKGDPGEGLDIKGKVDTTYQLPATASEGDGYLVNEELYVYTSGAWKDCGTIQGPQGIQGKTGTGVSSTTIQYQIANSATTTPTGTWSNTLIATTQVNPFLWTQVTLNYDDGTSKSFYLVSSKGDKGDKGDKGATGPVGPPGPVGAGLVVKGTVSNASQLPTTGNQEGYCYFVGTDLYVFDAGAWKNCGNVSPDLSNYVTVTDLNNGLSTKVNVSDMRKPASDVAGIEEVSTLQAQVNNSAVGTNLLTNSNFSSGLDNWIVNGGTNSDCKAVVTTDSGGDTCVHITGTGNYCGIFCGPVSFDQNQVTTGSVLAKGTGTLNWVGLSSRRASNFGTISTESYSKVGSTMQADSSTKGFAVYFDPVNGVVDVYIKFVKLELGSHATDYSINPSEIMTKADNSKAAHLSGANNFDTVPTVNNNPLLLASSLPSDLARTGQDQEFTGKNTFDVAPIDKTTGNPYITKDGVPAVPSTLADTTKLSNFTAGLQSNGTAVATTSDVTTAISTATANMVDSSKPTNFTAGLQSGGVDVATAADLKSVEDASWHEVTIGDGKYFSGRLMYQKDIANKKLLFGFSIQILADFGYTLSPDNNYVFTIFDFDKIITGFTSSPDDSKQMADGILVGGTAINHITFSGTTIGIEFNNNTDVFRNIDYLCSPIIYPYANEYRSSIESHDGYTNYFSVKDFK